jgi:hypothetical protein
MLQGFEEEFNAVLTDILTLQKVDGRVFENIKAHVTRKSILIMDVHLQIEAGDRLIRTLPSGTKEIFVVDDCGYHEALAGIPAHVFVKVHTERSAKEATRRPPPVSRIPPPRRPLSGISAPLPPVVTVPRVMWDPPGEFPSSASANVFAAKVRAADILEQKKNSVDSDEQAESMLLQFVLQLFAAFVEEAHKLAKEGIWSGAQFESECLDFLLDRRSKCTSRRGVKSDPICGKILKIPNIGDAIGPCFGKSPRRRREANRPSVQKPGAMLIRAIRSGCPCQNRAKRQPVLPKRGFRASCPEHPGATYADIKYSARVHAPEFQDWRKEKLKPTSVMSKRIDDVLNGSTPLKKKPPQKRAD